MSAEPPQADGLAIVPGLVRLGASAWWHTAEWALRSYMRAWSRLLGVALAPATAPELLDDLREEAHRVVRSLIELTEHPDGAPAPDPQTATAEEEDVPSLREEGAALLRRSRDVHYHEPAHPAYERILTELAPDEARILRLLLLHGPQPAVDVRTGGPLGLVSSRLIAPGLTMIGARAGCRYVERVPSYLNNLFRLGMIWFSRETVRDPLRYQVLEAQPEVLEAVHSVRYAKIVRRSIHLTPFGEDFCRMAFIEDDAARLADLPEHSLPPGVERAPQPPPLAERD